MATANRAAPMMSMVVGATRSPLFFGLARIVRERCRAAAVSAFAYLYSV
jgi:hypothetical protein